MYNFPLILSPKFVNTILFLSGWILIAAVMGLFAILVALFPKELPDSAVRKILSNQDKDEKTKKEEEDASNVSWHGEFKLRRRSVNIRHSSKLEIE